MEQETEWQGQLWNGVATAGVTAVEETQEQCLGRYPLSTVV